MCNPSLPTHTPFADILSYPVTFSEVQVSLVKVRLFPCNPRVRYDIYNCFWSTYFVQMAKFSDVSS